MQHAAQNQELKQKQLICLGLIAMNESMTASQLIGALYLKDSDALRSWLKPLIDKGFVVSTDAHSKAKEYRVDARVLRDSGYKGTTSLKRIESYRIKELIIEDLKIYQIASANEIRERIGSEIPQKKIWTQLQVLIEEGKIQKIGTNRWLKYQLL